jgi:SAM-dependent methyltransferase
VRLGLLGRAPAEYDDRFVDSMASAYLDQTPWTRLRLSAVRDLVEPAAGERVLDLGCAAGAVTHFLSTYACDPVGVDAEPRAIASARSLFPALRFEVAGVTELPFPDRSFDKAVAADLVEHIGDVAFDRMLRECVRVLIPGGTLSIYTPNPAHVIERLKARDLLLARNETHIGLRGSRELGDALRRGGFEVERDEWRPSFIPALRSLERLGGDAIPSLRYRLCVRGRKTG